jgi:hypothetical protein
LALHTDQGLFIAIVPSVRLSKSGSAKQQQQQDDDDASFYIQLSNGRKAHVKLPSNGNCLLFMIGDGSNYLLPNSHFPLRPVPHGLALESSPSEDVVRVWFGRMFFAPNDAILTDKMPTFDGMMQLAVESRRLNENFPVLSCGPSSTQQQTQPRALHDVSGHNCSAGFAYCWMACRPLGALSSSCNETSVECRNNVTNALWEDCPTCHDRNARLVCPSSSVSSFAFKGAELSLVIAFVVISCATWLF